MVAREHGNTSVRAVCQHPCTVRCTLRTNGRRLKVIRPGHSTFSGTLRTRKMSFRSRLLLFFMIIVIVPMIAVALVLFSITADSETGKADAAIAQGLRASFAVYDGDRAKARPALEFVARDPLLAAAIAKRDTAAATARLKTLQRAHPAATRIAAYDNARRQIAAVGPPDAVAPAVAAPSTGTKRIGLIAVSTTSADQYARDVKRLTGLEARVIAGGRLTGSTLGEATGRPAQPQSGNASISGQQYRGRFAPLSDVA